MEEHIGKFLESLATRGFSKNTIAGYRKILRYFKEYLNEKGVHDFTEVTSEHIHAYQHYLYHEHRTRDGKAVSLGTQTNRLKVLGPLFRFLVKECIIISDPTVSLEMPRMPKRLPRDIMTQREVRRFLAGPDTSNPKGLRDRAILEVLYATGIRCGELIDLKMKEVNLNTREIMIIEGKGCKDRIVPLAREAARYVERYINNAREELLKGRRSDYLFVNNRGNHMNGTNMSSLIRKYREKARLKKNITTHSFRHTCATHLLKNSANIRVIQELLGHNSLVSTQRYTRVEISDLKRAIDKYHPREDLL